AAHGLIVEPLRQRPAKAVRAALGAVQRARGQVEELRCAGEEQRVVLDRLQLDAIAYSRITERAPVGGHQLHALALEIDALAVAIRTTPALAVDLREHAALPLERADGLRAIDAHVHHRPRAGFDLPDLAERHLRGKAGKK